MRIFWKLFVSFWVALVLFAGSVVVLASHYVDGLREQRGFGPPRVDLRALHEQAEAALSSGGPEALLAWIRRHDSIDAVPLLFLDAQGHDILGRDVTARTRQHHERHLRRDRDEPDVRPPPYGAAGGHPFDEDRPPPPKPRGGPREPRQAFVLTVGEVRYHLMPDFPAVTLGRMLARPRVFGPPVLLAALVGALVCFFLALYLTAPIVHLRRAMLDFAAGKLDTRVTPKMGRRRDEISDLARSLDHMAERLAGLITSHKQLLRDVSHELRSPLARMQAALGLARQRAGKSAQPELDRIERESERLNDLISRLLTLARMEAGRQPVRREPVDMGALVETVVADAALEAHDKGCEVTLSGACEGTVLGDDALLHSLLENVVRNAVKYTAPGTVVNVRASLTEQDRLELRVCDQGPGVPPAMLETLFEPFVRVSDARDRASGGYGIGLAIAERAARLHGGDIRAENAPGGGLCVTITLPLAASPPPGSN